jgi:hypothetical protein
LRTSTRELAQSGAVVAVQARRHPRGSLRRGRLRSPAQVHLAPSTVKLSRSEARTQFERRAEFSSLPAGSKLEVLVDELVYQDGSRFDAVGFLEPGYFFLYIVRTPILGSNEYVVSKKLNWFLPVTSHGETQLPSREAQRRVRESEGTAPNMK